MTFQVRTEERPGATGPLKVWVMEDGRGAVAEICPALGFNCYRWHVPSAGELLYCDPNFFTDGKPTRSGIPVLFPFPNRIRDGRFSWGGKQYQLPLNDPAGKNAIHGFACRHPWRVVAKGTDDQSAWVTGEFQCSVDAPEAQALWPADHRLRLTCRLRPSRLRLEAVIETPGSIPLPFGLGYHPYFLLPDLPAGSPRRLGVAAAARSYWELQDSLPTGIRCPVDAGRDLNRPRPADELQLDDVLTDLPGDPTSGANGLCERGLVNGVLRLYTSPAFRELVAFTPPHRKAICLEPYTCTTDAINLQQRGIDAGLLMLPPGAEWTGLVEMVVVP
jgi:aldose 1-epimerase